MKLIDMWKQATKTTKVILMIIIAIILVTIVVGLDAGLVKNTASSIAGPASEPGMGSVGASPF